MRPKRIYIADDEVNILDIISAFVKREGYDVTTFTDGRQLLEAFERREPDLLIIDIMMPGLDGYSLCSLIRQKSTVPIIMVSAKDTEADRITGLTLGSDDYLTKPFSPLELVARVKSIFRRIEMEAAPASKRRGPLRIADISIDPDTRRVECRGRELPLTRLEFSLLHYMAANRSRAVSRNELLDKVWGFESTVETRATDDAMKRLRGKLADAGSELKIDTVWGFGFRVREREGDEGHGPVTDDGPAGDGDGT